MVGLDGSFDINDKTASLAVISDTFFSYGNSGMEKHFENVELGAEGRQVEVG